MYVYGWFENMKLLKSTSIHILHRLHRHIEKDILQKNFSKKLETKAVIDKLIKNYLPEEIIIFYKYIHSYI